MKKISLLTMLLAVIFTSCEKEQDMYKVLPKDEITKPVMEAHDAIVCTPGNLAEETTFKWTLAGDFGQKAPITYTLYVQVPDTLPFALGSTSGDSLSFSYENLNNSLNKAGAKPNETTAVQFFVEASVSVAYGVSSDPITVSVTPFEVSATYVYAVGAFNGWAREGGYRMASALDNGIYITYINFPAAASPFLIMPDNTSSWDHKWGSDDGATLIKDGGADIQSPGAGWYKITADLINLTIAFEPYSWGIIGDATAGGWDADQDMAWNFATDNWESTLALSAGAMKFRLNDTWDVNYGGSGLTGTGVAGGDNISISEAGTYFITFNSDTQAYSIVLQE